MQKKITTIEYMCTHCGQKHSKSAVSGRPAPGNCLRRPKIGGKYQPHRWVINRRY